MAEREEDVYERKESKKDKGYVAFRSDDDSIGEEEEEDSRYVQIKISIRYHILDLLIDLFLPHTNFTVPKFQERSNGKDFLSV